ncbi:Methyltransferase FkbM [Trinorchestia longiramus]|nr:Methyltransferase FkbM [Trinorchestia longiramus]
MPQKCLFDELRRWARPVVLCVVMFAYVVVMSLGVNLLSRNITSAEGGRDAEGPGEGRAAVARTLRNIMHDLNNETTQPDDPHLIQIIRENFLEPASTQPYFLVLQMDPSDGQAKIVDQFFKHKRNGVFVECGGYDGEFLSNTVFLERFRGWTGLLIEPEPANFKQLRSKNRKAIISNSCLSVKSHPSEFILKQETYVSEIFDPININWSKLLRNFQNIDYQQVQCFPLYSFLLATNLTSVDYFSLDVEGQELNVLKTVPWSRVDIKVVSVEYRHVVEGKDAVTAYLAEQGYQSYVDVPDSFGHPSDTVFVRKDLLPTTNTE